MQSAVQSYVCNIVNRRLRANYIYIYIYNIYNNVTTLFLYTL